MRAKRSLTGLILAGVLAGTPAGALGAPPWSAPVSFSTPGRALPSAPAIAISPEGRAVIAWWRRDSSLAPRRDVVQIRTRATPSAAFIGPTSVSRRRDNPGARPDVAAAAGRLALVGWTDDSHAVGLRALPASGPAVPPTLLPEGAAVALDDLDIALAPSGAAVAVWTRDPFPVDAVGGDRTVRVSLRPPGGGAWSAAVDLSAPGAGRPVVAMGPDGSAIAVWERGGGVEASVKGAAGGFGAPVALAASGIRPAVAMNQGSDAVIAWFETAVVASLRPAGGAFGPAEPISPPGGLPAIQNLRRPQLHLAAGGRAIAAWRRAGEGIFRIEAAIRAPGAPWGAAATLSPASLRHVGDPSLGADAAGRAIVAWSQPVGRSRSAIRARALPGAATAFGALESVSTAAGRGTAPAVALDAGGRAVLAWREDPVGGRGRFIRAVVRFSPG